MNPKEKAKELVWKYLPILEGWKKEEDSNKAKKCALIAVEEILKVLHTNIEDRYWNEVKQEIEKL